MNEKKNNLLRKLEALIFASEKALHLKDIKKNFPKEKNIEVMLKNLKENYKDKGINLKVSDNNWYFETAPDLSDVLKEYKVIKKKLSKAAMETLSIIAYFQPITKPELEEIRGVTTHPGIFEILINNDWIESKGRKDVPGRPSLWTTTKDFLMYFNLESLKDLPSKKELVETGLLTKGDNLKIEIEK